MNSNSSSDRRKGAPVAPGSGSGASAGGGSGSGGASASSGGSVASMRQRHRSRSPVPTEQEEAGNGGGGGGEAAAADELQSHKRARTAGPAAGAMTGGSRSAGATPARPSYFAYSPTSILASMNGSAAALPLPPVPPPVTLPYHSALSPGTAIHSPRRAMVCSSLEHAAVASSLLTQSAIHPAILHSLSVRLQAMSDAEADIVLGRLSQIASHLQHSQSQTSRKQQQLQFLQAMSAAGAAQSQSQTQAHPGTSTQSAAAAAASGTLPPSPMPNLSSTSSVNSSNNSNTTSPTVSPAVSAQTATAPPSPQNQLAQKPPPTPPQASLTAHLRDSASHPPLHPQPTLTPYAQMLLSSNGARMQLQQQQQQLHHQQQAQHAKDGGASAAPQPLRTSFVGATTSTSSASTTSPSGDDLPQLDSSLAPPLARSHSEDSDIPMGLMMLIEALPGATTATLAGGVGSSGVGVGGGMATPGGAAQSEQLKSPHTPHHALKANVNSGPHDALSGPLQSRAPSGFAQLQLQVADLLPPPVTRQRSTSL